MGLGTKTNLLFCLCFAIPCATLGYFAYESIMDAPDLLIVSALVLLVSVLAFRAYLVRSIIVPIKGLTSAIEDLSKGSFDALLPKSANHEIARLISGFREMRTAIRSKDIKVMKRKRGQIEKRKRGQIE